MATTVYNLQNDAAKCKKISSAQWNKLANTLELVAVSLAEFGGSGFLTAGDFNASAVVGQKKASVSSGRVIVGETGERKLVHEDDLQEVDLVGTTVSPQVNYGYVTQEGTVTVVQNPMNAPANSMLAWTCDCDDDGGSNFDNFPDGRVNLLSFLALKVTGDDRQGGYLNDKLDAGTGVTLTVTGTGADEKLVIAVDPAAILDYKVKADGTDTQPDYLGDALLAGTGITVAVETVSGTQRKVRITNSAPDDKKLLTSGADTVAAYLGAKLSAGAGITIEEIDGAPGAGKIIRITADAAEEGGTDIKVKSSAADAVAGYLSDKLQEGDGITIEVVDGAEGEKLVRITSATASLVKVDEDDTTSGYLADKLSAGTNISLTVVEDEETGEKTLVIAADAFESSDELVKTSAGDTVAEYLAAKLTAGTGIAVEELTEAVTGRKYIRISNSATTADEKVKVNGSDTQADYLGNKLIAGSGIAIDTVVAGTVRTLRIRNTGSGITKVDLPEFTVTLEDSDQLVLKLDFEEVGEFPDGRYFVWVNLTREDESEVPNGKIVVTEGIMEKTGSVCYLFVQVACDAGLGADSLDTEDITFNVSVAGTGYATAGGTTMTVTPVEYCNTADDVAAQKYDAPVGAFFMDDIGTNITGSEGSLKNAWMGGAVCKQGLLGNISGKITGAVLTFSNVDWGSSDAELEIKFKTDGSGGVETVTVSPNPEEAISGSYGTIAIDLQSLDFPLDIANYHVCWVTARLAAGSLNSGVTLGVVLYGWTGNSQS
jgi:hypothetical protein